MNRHDLHLRHIRSSPTARDAIIIMLRIIRLSLSSMASPRLIRMNARRRRNRQSGPRPQRRHDPRTAKPRERRPTNDFRDVEFSCDRSDTSTNEASAPSGPRR